MNPTSGSVPLLTLLLVGLGMLLFAPWVQADTHIADKAPEEQIKSAFLFNFIKFIKWPDTFEKTTAPLTLCLAGMGGSSQAMTGLAGQRIRDHALEVRQVVTAADLYGCHILFITADIPSPLLAEASGREQLLLVGEQTDFCHQGGHINFYRDGEKVRFEINPAGLQLAGLTISSKLLSLARIINR